MEIAHSVAEGGGHEEGEGAGRGGAGGGLVYSCRLEGQVVPDHVGAEALRYREVGQLA